MIPDRKPQKQQKKVEKIVLYHLTNVFAGGIVPKDNKEGIMFPTLSAAQGLTLSS